MNRGQFLKIALLLPVCIALVLSVVFYMVLNTNQTFVSPLKNGMCIAHFDSREHLDGDDTVIDSADDLSSLNINDNLGEVSIGNNTQTLRYNAEYIYQKNSMSLMPQSNLPGESGCVYIYTFQNKIFPEDIGKSIKLQGAFGNHNYSFVREIQMSSENEVLNYSADYGKSLVLYCQKKQGSGLSRSYTAYVYKEVA